MIDKGRRIIAILRGVRPTESVEVGNVLVDAGITWIEVPLNSPEPFKSIELLSKSLERSAKIGAGTVLKQSEISLVKDAGGQFVVSPNTDPAVIESTKDAGLESCPGVFTASEAFLAINAGADVLKLFPAALLGPPGIRALKAVLPPEPPLYAVGGADSGNFDEYKEAGVTGFGIGSSLYKPGDSAESVQRRAREICSAYDKLYG